MNNENPLGWLINLLYQMAHCCTVLSEDIDYQIQYGSLRQERFSPQKKRYLYNYEKAIKEANMWMDKFGLDESTYEAVEKNNKRYSNVVANANTLIRMMMLCLDRAYCDGGDARVFKRLRSLPENGLFSEKTMDRFRMKLEIIPEVGDHISTQYGEAVLDTHLGNGNWQVTLSNGEHKILNEKHFTLL